MYMHARLSCRCWLLVILATFPLLSQRVILLLKSLAKDIFLVNKQSFQEFEVLKVFPKIQSEDVQQVVHSLAGVHLVRVYLY